MDYEVAFEISQSGIGELTFALSGLLFVGIGAILIRFRSSLFKGKPKWVANLFSYFFFGFSIVWTLGAGIGIGFEQSSLRDKYAAGNFNVIEGKVENFDPMPAEGHKMESFTVKGVKFEYSDFMVTPGFHNAASRGGPIKEGLPVRISYIGNTILKLEVPKVLTR
ncbi:MAG: hypothetical protein VYA55_21990 [Pseudomonadota bacterium]|nr:hypothetical protein [Pseudomonadota bacterium]